MAHFDQTRPVVSTQGFGARITKTLTQNFQNILDWNEARLTRNALRKLSDHELTDLGLSRGDIEAMEFRR